MTPTPREPESLFPTLSPEVLEALDAAIERRAGINHTSNVSADADAKVASLLSLLDQMPAEAPSDDLVARTLKRIETERVRSIVEDEPSDASGFRIGFRMGELAVIAAMLIVGISLVWPMLDQMRSEARKVACANNLTMAGSAVAAYATDNQNLLPNRGAVPGSVWWNVGESNSVKPLSNDISEPVSSNSSNLYTIVRDSYIAPDNLNCPSNENAIKALAPTLNDWPTGRALSYSYQNQYFPHPSKLDRYRPMAIMADKNPLFVPRPGQAYGLQFSGLSESTNSRFHAGLGQNILFRDMSVLWSKTPTLSNGDNIWTANGQHVYRGTEVPAKDDDTFLVP